MTDYSQNREQERILKAVGKQPGRFLDIGAYDGNHSSNTRALIDLGWSGVLVEPGLEAFLALLQNHGDNPKLTLVHAAVGLSRRLVRFWNTSDVFSTLVESWKDTWSDVSNYRPSFLISSITLDDLLREIPGPVGFLSIDAEGLSPHIFQEFPLDRYNPRAIIVEHQGQADKCLDSARKSGYSEVYRNAENLLMTL